MSSICRLLQKQYKFYKNNIALLSRCCPSAVYQIIKKKNILCYLISLLYILKICWNVFNNFILHSIVCKSKLYIKERTFNCYYDFKKTTFKLILLKPQKSKHLFACLIISPHIFFSETFELNTEFLKDFNFMFMFHVFFWFCNAQHIYLPFRMVNIHC